MSRSPLDIIVADPSFTVYVRCDGEKIEHVVAHDRVLVLQEISATEAIRRGQELIKAGLQILEKQARGE